MTTETQTPIETLKRAQIYNCRSADPEHCKLPICTDARTVLEDVEALVERAKDVMAIINESRGVVGFHLNGAIAEWSEFSWVEDLDIALVKFQVES